MLSPSRAVYRRLPPFSQLPMPTPPRLFAAAAAHDCRFCCFLIRAEPCRRETRRLRRRAGSRCRSRHFADMLPPAARFDFRFALRFPERCAACRAATSLPPSRQTPVRCRRRYAASFRRLYVEEISRYAVYIAAIALILSRDDTADSRIAAAILPRRFRQRLQLRCCRLLMLERLC